MLSVNTYILIFVSSLLLTRDLFLDVPGDLFADDEYHDKFLYKFINGVFHSGVLILVIFIADRYDFIERIKNVKKILP